jgi:HEAT repeat protein
LLELATGDENWFVRRAALQELARGWQGHVGTVSFLRERATDDENERVRRAAVEELRRGWPDHPVVRAFLAGMGNLLRLER